MIYFTMVPRSLPPPTFLQRLSRVSSRLSLRIQILLVLCGFGSAFFAVKGIKGLLYRAFVLSLAPKEPDKQLPRRQHLPAASRRRLESDRLQQCPSHPDDPPNPLDTDFEPFFPHQNNNEQHPIPDASPDLVYQSRLYDSPNARNRANEEGHHTTKGSEHESPQVYYHPHYSLQAYEPPQHQLSPVHSSSQLVVPRAYHPSASIEHTHPNLSRGDNFRKPAQEERKARGKCLEEIRKKKANSIYRKNNKGRNGIIDLHRLSVRKAIERTDIAIQNAINQGNSNLRLIVDQGHHSLDGPKLRPALLKHLRMRGHYAEVQQYNAGVIDVRLVSSNRVILRDAALWDSC
ncbi:hypothetical protein C8R41DRAFT_818677 [Lentinula lateritia]|uniref:Smr domain-containing protein n=1 Tax=Lentinula lateritia TaxID=40482 RepID=A0ABQ8VPH5_9AGAR|nr:hypothetical protein C8R41DRAFT_818677 [Lentinula lateritia]